MVLRFALPNPSIPVVGCRATPNRSFLF